VAVDLSGNIFGTTFVEGDVNNNSICPKRFLALAGAESSSTYSVTGLRLELANLDNRGWDHGF